MTVAALAQDSSQPKTASGSVEERDPHPKLLVSTYGKIIEGQISQSASGYVVDVGGGSFLIPFKMVKFSADSRHDAYQKYRKLMPEQTADNHITLAKWCIENMLLNDASHELKQALYLEPNRKEAARLLAYVESRSSGGQSSTETTSSTNSPRPAALARKPASSPQGLSPSTVSQYSSTIQPILMNNCAKAGCHHSTAKNRFKLEYVRLTGYGNRLASAKNLAGVLRQLDTADPEQSPLLIKARSNHGEARQTLILAPQGKEILARLERWVENASSELNPPAAQSGSPSVRSEEPVDPMHGSSQRRRIDRESLPKNEQQFVREILNQQKYDPFDPARFNRSLRPSGN